MVSAIVGLCGITLLIGVVFSWCAQGRGTPTVDQWKYMENNKKRPEISPVEIQRDYYKFL